MPIKNIPIAIGKLKIIKTMPIITATANITRLIAPVPKKMIRDTGAHAIIRIGAIIGPPRPSVTIVIIKPTAVPNIVTIPSTVPNIAPLMAIAIKVTKTAPIIRETRLNIKKNNPIRAIIIVTGNNRIEIGAVIGKRGRNKIANMMIKTIIIIATGIPIINNIGVKIKDKRAIITTIIRGTMLNMPSRTKMPA